MADCSNTRPILIWAYVATAIAVGTTALYVRGLEERVTSLEQERVALLEYQIHIHEQRIAKLERGPTGDMDSLMRSLESWADQEAEE